MEQSSSSFAQLDLTALQYLETALHGDASSSQLQEYLQTVQKQLINPLFQKRKNEEARRVVSSGKLPDNKTLDPVPDIEQSLLLSDELDLDELECVSLIETTAPIVSAEAAMEEYFERRSSAINCLITLLVTQVSGYGNVHDDLFAVVEKFNMSTLLGMGCNHGGKEESTILVSNLCASIKETAASMDKHIRMRQYKVKECLELCECLVLASCIKQRMGVTDVSAMLDALRELVQHHLSEHASLVVVAIMLTLLPQESLDDEAMREDTSSLKRVVEGLTFAASAPLSSTGAGTGTLGALGTPTGTAPGAPSASHPAVPESAHLDIAEMVCSVMRVYCSPSADPAAPVKFLKKGVLGEIKRVLFKDLPSVNEVMDFTVASAVYQFLRILIDVSDGMEEEVSPVPWMVRASKENALEEIRAEVPGPQHARHGPNGHRNVQSQHGPDHASHANSQMQIQLYGNSHSHHGGSHGSQPVAQSDSIGSLLELWAVCLKGSYPLFEAYQEHVAKFLRAVGTDEQLIMVPSVFIGHMRILSAVASTEQGAEVVFRVLHDKNASPHVAWRKLFATLKSVIAMYEGIVSSNQQISSTVLPEADTNGLCAFVDVFTQVMSNGPLDEALKWIQDLEEECGVAPSWEILFEAMCCPVPQKLKATLDEAIASLARHQSLVGPIWDRLLGAVVVRKDPLSFDGRKSVPVKYDLTYQLNEIEARAEEYEEAIAFVRLLNALWKASGASFTDGGAKYEHFTRFVLEEIASSIYQRSFKHERERWELISESLVHCRLCLESLPKAMEAQASVSSVNPGASTIMTPGEYVMTDLLEARSLFRVVNYTLSLGTDWLSEQVFEGALAEVKACAVVESLRLVRCAMGMDVDFIAIKQNNMPGKVYSPFEAVLLHDRERIPTILDYARCPWDVALRRESLLVSQLLISRVPEIVGRLQSIYYENGQSIKSNLQKGYSTVLKRANTTAWAHRQEDEEECAQIALDIILDSLKSGISSNFGEYICGFEVCAGVDYMSLENPSFTHSPLRDILDVTASVTAATSRPRIYEKCLQVIYFLCETPQTSQYFVHYLLSSYAGLAHLIPDVLFAPLPVQRDSQVSSMYHRAWLLRILAIEIFNADVSSMAIKENVVALLKDLFEVHGEIHTHSSLAGMLQGVLARAPKERWLGDNLGIASRKMLTLLDVESLLNPKLLERGEGTSLASTWRGDVVIDTDLLKDELLRRYVVAIANHDDLVENLKEAAKHALEHADDLNHFTEYTGGVQSIASGAQAVVLATAASKFDVILQACENPSIVAQYLCMAIEDCTSVLERGARGCTDGLGVALECMASRLRDLTRLSGVSGGVGASDLDAVYFTNGADGAHESNSQVFSLVATSLLGRQLGLIWGARQQEGVRIPMYNTLCIYVDMIQNSKTLGSAVMEDSINILYQNMRSLQPIIADSMSSQAPLATSGLMMLAALLSYDPTTGVASAVHTSPLPAKILQDIQDADPRMLASSVFSSRANADLLEAKVDLLLNLTLAGQVQSRSSSVQKMVSLQIVPKLSSCKVFDMRPEKSGIGFGSSSSLNSLSSSATYLHQFIGPSLRVILSVMSTLSQSDSVLKQVSHQFLETHPQLIDRILKEAGGTGSALGWTRGTIELEEATLVVQISTILAVARAKCSDIRVHRALHEALLDLASKMFVLNARCQAPFVCSVEDYRRSGKVDAAAEKASKALFELRSALSAYLRTAIDGLLVDANSLMLLLQSALYQAAMFDLPHVISAGGVGLPALVRFIEHLLASMFTVMTRMKGLNAEAMRAGMDMDGIKRGCAAPLAALEGVEAELSSILSSTSSPLSLGLLVRKVKGALFAS